MKKYIDVQDYCENICRCAKDKCDKNKCPIWTAPAADVVEVVRCKDCQHGENNYFQHGLCLCRRPVYTGNSETTLNVLCTSDSFCSYGERKAE